MQFPVWVTDISTLSDALQMITDIGDLTGTAAKAAVPVADIAANFAWLEQDMPERAKTAYLIWRKPYMAAGGGTFIQGYAGRVALLIFFERCPRYPQVTPEQMTAAGCELLLLSSEPYPFAQKHIAEITGSTSAHQNIVGRRRNVQLEWKTPGASSQVFFGIKATGK